LPVVDNRAKHDPREGLSQKRAIGQLRRQPVISHGLPAARDFKLPKHGFPTPTPAAIPECVSVLEEGISLADVESQPPEAIAFVS
jgi:hypothetical protein